MRDKLRVFAVISPEAHRAVEKEGERQRHREGEGAGEREREMKRFIECCLGWRLVVRSPPGSPWGDPPGDSMYAYI